MGHFFTIVILCFGFISNSLAKDHPAVFQTSLGPISTLDQYVDRIESKYPELENTLIEGERVVHNDESLSALIFKTKGEYLGNIYDQTLIYGEITSGLWKLLSLENRTCNQQTQIFNGLEEVVLICDDDQDQWLPISGAFADIFLVDSANLDLSVLSEAIGREVSLYTPVVEVEELLTLSEVESILRESGATWEQSSAVWNGFGGQDEDQPAISIRVTGQPKEDLRFDQTFLYFYRDDQLILGSVDGEVCEFRESQNDFVCDEAFNPTDYTPFPFILSQVTLVEDEGLEGNNEGVVQEEELFLSCGYLDQNYSNLLRYHFNRSAFEIYEAQGFRKSLAKIAVVLDPENLLTSAQSREIFQRIDAPPYLFASQVNEFANEVRLGLSGECGFLVDLTEDLIVDVEDATIKVKRFLSKVERLPENDSIVLSNPFDLKLWSWVLDKASKVSFFGSDKAAAIDIALGQLESYLSEVKNYSTDLELLMTAAFFKEDAYSHLINEKNFSMLTQNQNTSGLYFGLQVVKGFKSHYILDLHPETRLSYSLKPGDEIIYINQQPAFDLSSDEVDQILLDTSNPLNLKIRRQSDIFNVTINSSYLDFLSTSYKLTQTNQNNKVYLLKLHNFSIGLTDRLLEMLKPLAEEEKIEGLILDFSTNAGGDVEEARRFLSLFITESPLFYSKIGSRGSVAAPLEQRASLEYSILPKLPLIVLTSDQTKSAAEIVTSSLKSHERALIIGGRTFGKFVAQMTFPVSLSNQKQVGLSVTAAEFFDPKGRALNGYGVEPHIKTLASKPPFQDGNGLGENFNDAEALETTSSYLSGLNVERVIVDGAEFINDYQPIELSLLVMDQSQKSSH